MLTRRSRPNLAGRTAATQGPLGMLNRLSLRRRVLLLSGIALLLGLGVGVAGFALLLDRMIDRAAASAAQEQSVHLAQFISYGDVKAVDAVQDEPSKGSVLQLLDMNGQVVAASDREGRARQIGTATPAVGHSVTEEVSGFGPDKDDYIVVARGIQDPQGHTYVLIVATPLDVENTTLWSATVLLGLGTLTLVGLMLLLIKRIIDGALKPVEQIRSHVERIRDARRPELLPVPPTGDEIARLAETMNAMLARLDRADASVRTFVSDASHELRSPLATMRVALEAPSAQEDLLLFTERDAVMYHEVIRMQLLVDDLLTLARADDDALALAVDEVDVDDLLHQEVRRLRATADHPIVADINAARVQGDSARLAQVLRNLIDNANRHTTNRVQLSVDTVAGWVVLRVDNDGAPIPVAERESVFDRFTRLEAARERDRGGSGLGLAIARTIVEAHHGTIRAGETPQGTCRFEVRLPAVWEPEPIGREV